MLVDGLRAGRLFRRAGTVALLVCALGALAAVAARAACGTVQQLRPQKNVSAGRAPIAIGDSPMLLALGPLADKGFRANARGCRQYAEGLALMRDLRRRDKLPRLVVVALGSNGVISKDNIHDALNIVGKRRTLGLVTPRESGGGAGHDAALVRAEAHKHENRIELIDWVGYSAGHPGWFQPDGLHLTFEGADAMARVFAKALKDLPPPHRRGDAG